MDNNQNNASNSDQKVEEQQIENQSNSNIAAVNMNETDSNLLNANNQQMDHRNLDWFGHDENINTMNSHQGFDMNMFNMVCSLLILH